MFVAVDRRFRRLAFLALSLRSKRFLSGVFCENEEFSAFWLREGWGKQKILVALAQRLAQKTLQSRLLRRLPSSFFKASETLGGEKVPLDTEVGE